MTSNFRVLGAGVWGLAFSDYLLKLGHNVEITEEAIGGGQAIMIDKKKGILIGGSDPRKDGLAIGY